MNARQRWSSFVINNSFGIITTYDFQELYSERVGIPMNFARKKILMITTILVMVFACLAIGFISMSQTVYAADYDLWVGGEQVTDANMSDIFGDGKASYDPSTKTLTLAYDPKEEMIFTTQEVDGIKSVLYSRLDKLTITGTAMLLASAKDIYGIYATGDIKITEAEDGDTLLNALGGKSSVGIFAHNIEVINAEAGAAGSESFYATNNIIFGKGSKVDASSKDNNPALVHDAIYAENKIIIQDGFINVLAETNGNEAAAMRAGAGIELSDSVYIETPAGGAISSDGKTIMNGNTIAKQINLLPKKNISKASVFGIQHKTYTGKTITQNIEVIYTDDDKSMILEKGRDYEVAYSDNMGPGTAKITITGKGDYMGTKVMTFEIRVNISDAVVAEIDRQVYTGKAIEPKPAVTWGGKTLKEGTDYTLSYKDNNKGGTATITITGIGNFKGEKSVTFEIVDKRALKKAIDSANNTLNATANTPEDIYNTPDHTVYASQEAKDAFREAIKAARKVYDKDSATQTEIDEAKAALDAATKDFINSRQTVTVDRTALEEAIADANSYLNDTADSTEDIDKAKTAYAAAIENAQQVFENEYATQAEIDEALAALNTATEAFNDARQPDTEDSTEPEEDLDDSEMAAQAGTGRTFPIFGHGLRWLVLAIIIAAIVYELRKTR